MSISTWMPNSDGEDGEGEYCRVFHYDRSVIESLDNPVKYEGVWILRESCT